MNELTHSEIGGGRVEQRGAAYTLSLPPARASAYSNAQISTYDQVLRFDLRPPLRLYVEAVAEGPLRGTAGFGLWNHPAPDIRRGLRLPRAAWFFHASPPNDMPLAMNVPGQGWKCATIDAANWRFLSLLPSAPVGFLLMRFPALYHRLWPIGQRALKVAERSLAPSLLKERHLYSLEWHNDRVTFFVDERIVFNSPHSPAGPLGFVAWIDNQFAIVTPQGRFGGGLLGSEQPQTLHLHRLEIEQV